MKRIALFAALLLAVVSCTPELDQNQNPENPAEQTKVVFHATFADPSAPDTKVFLNDEWKLRWNEGDAITVFNRNDQNQAFNATVKQDGAAADFTPASGDGVGSGNAVSHIYAVYPYQSAATISSSGALSLTLPAQQAYYGGNSFGQGANTMVSVTDDENLVFKNAGAYLELKLYGTDVNITRVSLTGNDGEKLAGDATVTVDSNGLPTVSMGNTAIKTVEMICSNPVTIGSSAADYTSFVLVIPPVTFSKGFTILVEADNGGSFKKSTAKSVAIERNKVISMAPIEIIPYKPVWGVVGAFNDWGGPDSGPKTDLVMTETSPGVWVSPAFKVPKGNASGDGFKVRKDYVWTKVNYGGTFTGFNERFDVYRDGANIQLSASQDYQVVVTLYDDGNVTPQIKVEPVDVWSVIGFFNGWGGDLEMTEESPGVWVSPVFDSHPDGGSGNDGFKLRKNYSWETNHNFGGTFGGYGDEHRFNAVGAGPDIIVDNNGDNHRISVKLDLNVNPATITVYDYPDIWSVMGDFNDWSADLDMTESSPGIWESPVFVTLPLTSGDGFKFRKNHDYGQGKYYGSFSQYEVPFEALTGDGNITVGDYYDQNFRISATLDLSNPDHPRITVHDQNIWSISGSFNGWGQTEDDIDLQKTGTYLWTGELTDIPAGTTFKLLKNRNWGYNWGAFNPETAIMPGTPLPLKSGGNNILIPETGSYEVVLNLEGTMTVTLTRKTQ